MRSSNPSGLRDAQRIIAANTTLRMAQIAKLEAYVKGTQYEGRPSWWSTGRPLLERAPCIVYPAAKNAIRAISSMVMGEGRFPRITANPGEDGEELDKDAGLDEADSAILDSFVNGPLKRHVRLTTVTRDMLRHAAGERASCVVVCARKGRLCVDRFPAKVTTPEFVEGGKPNEVECVEVRYPYLYEYWDDVSRTWSVKARMFRRVIDSMRDVTYLPIEAPEDGSDPPPDVWREDASKTFVHSLGRCPVIWYPHGGRQDDGVDGSAVHDELLDEIDALNFSLSQRHRAGLYSGDPQIVEIGVDADTDPAVDGSTAVIYVDHDDAGGRFVSRAHDGNEQGSPARRKGAGTVWRYPNDQTKVNVLTLPSGALDAIDNDAKDIKSKLDESFAVVYLDPGNSSIKLGELSGSAIRKLYTRQTANCDEIREDFGENGILALVDMLLWFIAKVIGRGDSLKINGIDKVAPILAKFCEVTEAGYDDAGAPVTELQWTSPELFLRWGEYFDDSADDELSRVRVANEAKTGGLVTLESAVEKVASIFGVQNPHEVAEQLEAKAIEEAKAMTDALHAHSDAGGLNAANDAASED